MPTDLNLPRRTVLHGDLAAEIAKLLRDPLDYLV